MGWQRKRLPALAVCVLSASALLAPATAGADPGSAVDQYVEGVPGAAGDSPTRDLSGGDADGQAGQSLPPAAQRSLEQLGAAGEETAALATETGPAGPESDSRETGDDAGAGGGAAGGGNADTGGDDGVFATASRLVDPAPGGIGLLLPLIVVGTLITAIAFVLRRQARKPDAVS
jgi:hypothetical protein